jgi:hypothetical protein
MAPIFLVKPAADRLSRDPLFFVDIDERTTLLEELVNAKAR